MLLSFLAACTGDPGPGELADLPFALDPVDVGEPLAAGTGFDPTDGDGVGLALDNVLPVFDAAPGADPAWDTPMAVWALLQEGTVQDPGVCPFELVRDGASIFEGGCRSSSGYEFEGDVTVREWSEGGADRYRMEADVEVIGDREDPAFERVRIVGALERAEPDDGAVDAHLDINLHIEVEGYWEQHGGSADDPQARAWRDWTLSGTIEDVDGAWMSAVAADVGGSGGLLVESTSIVQKSTCPVEAEGEARLGEAVTAAFEGAGGSPACDACARVTTDEGETVACGPD